MTTPIASCSLNAGMIAIVFTRRLRARPARGAAARGDGRCARRARARGRASHRRSLRRVGEQLAIRSGRLICVVDDEELRPRLEPALDSFVRVRDDAAPAAASSNGRQLDDAYTLRVTGG